MRILWLLLALGACEAQGTIVLEDSDDTDDPLVDDTDDTDDTGDTGDTDTGQDPPPDCVPYGVSVTERALLDQDARIDSFGSDPSGGGSRGSLTTNATRECSLDVRQGVVMGPALVGVGGYPDVALCTGRAARVEGRRGALETAVVLRPVPPPRGLPQNGGDKVIEWREEVTFSADRVFDDLRVRTGGKLVIEGDLDILVRGSLEVNAAVVELSPGSHLDLWVEGDASISWRGLLNPDGDPSAVRVHLIDDAPLTVSQGGEVRARVSAPQGRVTINGSVLWGTIQAREAELVWRGQVHVDEASLCE